MLEAKDKIKEIREYLLGTIRSDEDLTRIEGLLADSDDYFHDFLIEEENLIQDYVDEKLTDEEREDFERIFLRSEDRRKRITFAYGLRDYISEHEPPAHVETKKNTVEPVIYSWWKLINPLPVRLVAAALVLTVLGGLAWWKIVPLMSPKDEVVVALNKAFKDKRPFETRISGLDYAPATTLRGANDNDVSDPRAFSKASAVAANAAEENATAANLHNTGRVSLAKKDFKNAAIDLEQAAAKDSGDASIFNDLGVTYLEESRFLKAGDHSQLELLGKALDNFEKSVRLNPNLLEAKFNRALGLQAMHADEKARDAWNEYLKLDPGSRWADDARQHLESLQIGKTANRTPDETLLDFLASFHEKDDGKAWKISNNERDEIKGKLIPQQLAFSFLNSEGKRKEELLDALSYAGQLEQGKRNDPFFAEIAALYAKSTPAEQAILRQAHQMLADGYKLALTDHYEEALGNFFGSRNLFALAGDEQEAHLCDFWVALSLHSAGKNDDHRVLLQKLAADCEAKGYRWLLGEAYLWLGVNAEERNEFTVANDFQKKVIALTDSSDDLYNHQKALAILAENYLILKDYDPMLQYMQLALESAAAHPESSRRQRWRTYNTIAKGFYVLKHYSAAAAFEEEVVTLGEQEYDKTFSIVGDLALGLIYAQQQRYKEAIDHANRSTGTALSLEDTGTKNKYLAISFRGSGDLKRLTGDCNNALIDYDNAIRYSSDQYESEQYSAMKGRLLCHRSQRNFTAIENELPGILTLFDQHRRNISEESTRSAFFNDAQNIYDLAIDYEYQKGDPANAFNLSETSRSRSLLDLLTFGAKISAGDTEVKFTNFAEPPGLEEIRRNIPENVQVLEYSVLDDKILIWLITKDKFEPVSYAIKSADLNKKVADYREALSKMAGVEKDASRELYRILIDPVEQKLDKSKAIAIVPDKFLFQVPFAALISPGGRYLVEDFDSFYSPSATVFLRSTQKAALLSTKSNRENMLVVGNATLDNETLKDLPPLPEAEREAKRVADLYHTVPVIGDEATKENVKQKLHQSNAVHIAGHYVVNEKSPMLSFFPLAGRDDDAKLTNSELLQENLENTRLMVLSACQTGAAGYYDGEGMFGVSRTFLGLGVPLVIASQWSVDSRATMVLMTRFHELRKNDGLSSSDALRKAQLSMLNHENKAFREPFYWAGFAPIGGYTTF